MPMKTTVAIAHSDSDLTTVGTIYTQVADGLAAQMPRSEGAALRLGYLTGAVKRGASGTNGTAIELVRRLNDPRARLVISHPGGDEGGSYMQLLRERIEDAHLDVRFITDRVGDEQAPRGI